MTASVTTARQYVVTGDWSEDESQNIALCTVDRMRKSIEYAAYSGDEDDARYFTMIDGKMTEVMFKAKPGSAYTDSDDYMHTEFGVFPVLDLGDEDPGVRMADMTDDPIDTFHVRIDGRA